MPLTRSLALLLALLPALAAPRPLPAGPIALPGLGDPSRQALSLREERRLGEAFMHRLRRQKSLIEDAEITAYLQSLTNRLVPGAEAPYPFTFFLVHDPSVNAFAAPGGYIGIHSGLLLSARDESELAAVLAHEIAHVTQRHMARTYEAAGRLSLPAAAALLAAVLIGSQDGEAGQAALMAIQAGSAQYQIDFTRAHEREADSIGMQILEEAGFDPLGMPAFFERLQRHSRYYGGLPPPFLRTHPVTSERIAEALGRARRPGAAARRDTLAFRLARARLRVVTARDPARLTGYFATRMEGIATPDPALRYGHALALQAAGRLDEARRLFSGLLADDPDQISYYMALGRVEQAAGRPEAALGRYEKAARLFPGNRALVLEHSRTLLELDRPAEAEALLNDLLRRRQPAGREAWRLLAEAAQRLEHGGEAHEALAEYQYLDGHLHAAIGQLELALKTPGLSFIQSARIEARLAEFREEALAEEKGE